MSNKFYMIKDDRGFTVDIHTANPEKTLVIQGRRVKVKDIPITVAHLECGHNIRGIAFQKGEVVSCEEHTPVLETFVAYVVQ